MTPEDRTTAIEIAFRAAFPSWEQFGPVNEKAYAREAMARAIDALVAAGFIRKINDAVPEKLEGSTFG